MESGKHFMEGSFFPKDLSFQDSLLTLTGKNELLLENFRGILEYTETQLLVLSFHYKIRIKGERLEVAYYTREEMKITGRIFSITCED